MQAHRQSRQRMQAPKRGPVATAGGSVGAWRPAIADGAVTVYGGAESWGSAQPGWRGGWTRSLRQQACKAVVPALG
jgi:hypothetical protein